MVPNVTQPHYVLNQNMHVLRDTLTLIETLARNEGVFQGWVNYEAEQSALLDALIAGLYQLAFPQKYGPLPAAADYMNRRIVGVSGGQNPLPYYWAHYEFLEGIGMRGISHERTCHYHFHALDVFGHIVIASERASVRDALARHPDGWRVHEAINALTQGEGEATGAAGSTNALYQFFRSTSPTFAERRQHCDHASSISQKSYDALASRFN